MTSTLIIIFICSYLAFSISAICGGGAGLMLLPILRFFLPMSQVPAALSIGTFTSSGTRLFVFRKNVNWSIVRLFVPAALPAVWLGAYLLKFLNPLYLEIIMGLFLVSNLPFVFKQGNALSAIVRPKNRSLMVIGFLAGFLSGLTGAVGLLFNKFYLRYGLSKEEIIATRAANEITLHLIKIVLYAFFGLLSMKVMAMGAAVALSAVISTWTVKYILPKISEVVFRKIGYAAMVLSGGFMLTQSTKDLFGINNGQVDAAIITKGIETKLQWQTANFSMEFTYDEGFEFEQSIPFNELSEARQQLVLKRNIDSDKIIVEEVFSFEETTYEAYYFKNQILVDKYDFE